MFNISPCFGVQVLEQQTMPPKNALFMRPLPCTAKGVFVGTTRHEKLLLMSVDKSTGRGDVYLATQKIRDTAEGNKHRQELCCHE